jgi:bifunctional non-homologous end joining protein LigD
VRGALDEYRRRRDFAKTPEPVPGAEVPDSASRFVIQRHDARALHFDLRLELGGSLASWAVPKGVPLRPGAKRLAVRTEDHPLEYLDFAAVIPAGQYGAGRMTIWDRGTFEPVQVDDAEIKIVLHGSVLSGEYHLVRTAGRDGKEEWLLFRSAKGDPGPADPLPRFRELRPMLATPWPSAFDDPRWAFEIKWDGYRALAFVGPDGTELRSRSGRDMTGSYPTLGDLRRAILAQEAVVDGEIVVLDEEGRAVFQDLQSGRGAVTFIVFDLLYADGEWLLDRPWEARRGRLEALLAPEAAPRVLCPGWCGGPGRRCSARLPAAARRGSSPSASTARTSRVAAAPPGGRSRCGMRSRR